MIVDLQNATWQEIEELYQNSTRHALELQSQIDFSDPLIESFSTTIREQEFGCQTGYVRGILQQMLILSRRYPQSVIDIVAPTINPKCRCAYGYLPYTVFFSSRNTLISTHTHSGSVWVKENPVFNFQVRHYCFTKLPVYCNPDQISSIFRDLQSTISLDVFISSLSTAKTE